MQTVDQVRVYRHIFILESRDWWESCKTLFDPERDMVLTYDLGLQRKVERLGGQAFYADHLVDNLVMQENNFRTYRFFRDWHLDADGKDIFTYRGIPFGFSFRIEIWNDLVFYVRARICLEMIKELRFESVFAGTQLGIVESILEEMNLAFVPVFPVKERSLPGYFFPIHQWMDEQVRKRSFLSIVRDIVTAIQGILMSWVDRVLRIRHGKPAIFIQEYYPTHKIVQRLKQDSGLRVILAQFTRPLKLMSLLAERPIPVWGSPGRFCETADKLLRDFFEKRCSKLILSNGIDISESVYRVIEKRISHGTAVTLRTLDCVIRYLDKNPIQMYVLIANVGQIATLVDCVSKCRGIPSYLISNGWLGKAYLDEGKYATVINGYSSSIKEHYFRGMDNVVCLGDPRMDDYVQDVQPRTINRETPTVTVGAAGHSNVDLNSYLAVEFEFMYDVLQALRISRERGVQLRIVIKVRANGYRRQYEDFVKEFFPGMVDNILDSVPMRTVLEKTDLYISIYSQTHFEASCLGIPCVYYKKDTEIFDPPYDGDSELVTVGNVDDLIRAIADFQSGHERYDAFLEKSVMEKYIGPLDGKNLDRNLAFIYDLLVKSNKGMVK